MRVFTAGALLAAAFGCGGPDAAAPVPPGGSPPATSSPATLGVLGQGTVSERYTAELWIDGTTAYTTTWGARTANGIQSRGNAVKIWDVSNAKPSLLDSIIIADATTLSDVQATEDGRYLIVSTESIGSIHIFDIRIPSKPVLITKFQNADIQNGVHTAEVQPVGGRLYAFLSVDPKGAEPARLVTVDITTPSSPAMVFSRVMGTPFVHDVFVRDGILMAALWTDGITIFDIGGGGKGGTVANPVQLGTLKTTGGRAHNIYWYKEPATGVARYAFVGEEGPGSIGSSSVGDIHVVDVSNMANPREVAFFNVPGAGAHNFSPDEQSGILYAAFYNGGVRALNIKGDLGTCTAAQKAADGRCDLGKMNREVASGPVSLPSAVYIWGVHYTGGKLYASDMLNGLLRLSSAP